MILPELWERFRTFTEARRAEAEPVKLQLRQSSLEGQGPNFPVETLDKFTDWVHGQRDGGFVVTPTTAMQLDVVWACIDRISSAVAQLPILTYRRTGNDGKERATDHYLYNVLRKRFNPLMTAFRGKKLMQTWLHLYGNAYAYVDLNERFQVTGLIPWHPSRTSILVRDGEPWYTYRLGNGIDSPPVHWNYMLHLRGLSTDGFMGLSPIQQHAQSIGGLAAVKEHGAAFFRNGARPLGVLESPGQLSPDAHENLRKTWRETHGGLANAHKVAILEEGLKYHETGISMVDAQYLESQHAGIESICRIYNVPPHKVQHLLRSTNNNIEFQGLEWWQDSISPHTVNWEEELTNICLSDRESEVIVIEFLMDYIMKADSTARANFYRVAVGGPIMTPNEARRKENLNPLPDGDKMYPSAQAKMPGGSDGSNDPAAEEPPPQQQRQDAREMLVRHNGRH